MKFRYDINGLRAIAVLPVLFFHSGIDLFKGGFLGVDVFFVISGFLITSNIIKEMNNDSFSILSFYNKRIRRIIPTLFFILIISTILSFIFMLPYDLKNFGQSLFSSSFGLNNILLYLTSGYWSLASEFKPLYHTWSLAVEEQYYFIIPVLFMLLYKKRLISLLLIFFCLLSWISSFVITNTEFNFLIITSRFWELCIGSLLALYIDKIKLKNNLLSLLGLFMIFFSYVNPYFISNTQAIYNLLPVLGTVMVISFSNEKGLLNVIAKSKGIYIIGVSSYSIYLLHQPLLSFFRLSNEGNTSTISETLIVLTSIPIGYFIWKWIETPLRNKSVIKNKSFYSAVIICFISFPSLGLILHKTYGLQDLHINSAYSYGNNPQKYADIPYALVKNTFETDNPKMLIFGNSFARDFINAINEAGITKGYEVIYYNEKNDNLDNLMSVADVVFWVSSDGMANRLIDEDLLKNNTLNIKKRLDNNSNNKYYFVGTKNYGFNNNFIKTKGKINIDDYLVEINKSNISANKIQSDIFGERYIDILSLTRVNNKTRLFTDDGNFISFDTDHITKNGAVYIGNLLLKEENISGLVLSL